jgi:hypothetical protein
MAKTEEDELVIATIDLDATRFGKETVFDFACHRRPEHYRSDRFTNGRYCAQSGPKIDNAEDWQSPSFCRKLRLMIIKLTGIRRHQSAKCKSN